MGEVEMAYSLKKSLEKFDRKSIYPWVNHRNKKRKRELINEYYKNIGLDESYTYENIRPLAELYHYFINLYDITLPNVRDTREGFAVYLTPSIDQVILGDKYVELSLSFNVDHEVNGYNLDPLYVNESTYRFIFRDDGRTEILRIRAVRETEDRVSRVRDEMITYHHHGVTLASFEWYLINHSFSACVRLLLNKYFDDQSMRI